MLLGISIWTQLEYLLRIVVAIICAGLIGLERERKVKSAGLKTHMIVAAGAALMMELSKYGFWDVLNVTVHGGQGKVDFSRMAASIVSAIGFLGAGIIFNRGFKINGVTTAAGLWATVGIGMAFGAGLYFIGAVVTLLILIIQLSFRNLKHRFLQSPVNVNLRSVGTMEALTAMRQYLQEQRCSVLKVTLIPLENPNQYEMDLHFTMPDDKYEQEIMQLLDRKDVRILSLDFEP